MSPYKKARNGYILTHIGYRDTHDTVLPEDLLIIARTGVDWSDVLAPLSHVDLESAKSDRRFGR